MLRRTNPNAKAKKRTSPNARRLPAPKHGTVCTVWNVHKAYVVNVDNQGAEKGKNKVQGGKRIMYTTHHPCWDAKNRHDLALELPFEFAQIAHCLPRAAVQNTAIQKPVQQVPSLENAEQIYPPVENKAPTESVIKQPESRPTEPINTIPNNIPKALADLMQANSVTEKEIQQAVASKGYYPIDTPIIKYDSNFVSGVLVGAWVQVFGMIQENRKLPF